MLINDIYERVWPEVIRSLETYGISILTADESDGIIKVSVDENIKKENSFFDYLTFWKSPDSNTFNLVLISEKESTTIEVQNDASVNITDTATEEVIRALHVNFR